MSSTCKKPPSPSYPRLRRPILTESHLLCQLCLGLSYVAEMMTNRLLRFFQKPGGVYHGSVFYQFSGGIGPSAVAVAKDGTIYVTHYDIATGK